MASNHSNQWFDGLNPIPIPTWSLTVRPWKVTKGPKRKPDRLPVPSWFSVAFAVQLRECVFLDWIGENRGFTSDPLGFTSVIPHIAGRVFYLELPCVRSSPVQLMAPWCERPNHDGIGWPNTQCMVYYIYLHLITVLFMGNECYIPYIECLGCWFNKTCRLLLYSCRQARHSSWKKRVCCRWCKFLNILESTESIRFWPWLLEITPCQSQHDCHCSCYVESSRVELPMCWIQFHSLSL